MVISGIVCWNFFDIPGIEEIGFRIGALSPWVAAVLGICSGVAIGQLAEYYTSADYSRHAPSPTLPWKVRR